VNPDVIAWLRSPEGCKWSLTTLKRISHGNGILAEIKEDCSPSETEDPITWRKNSSRWRSRREFRSDAQTAEDWGFEEDFAWDGPEPSYA
jgi:hypothetical protein